MHIHVIQRKRDKAKKKKKKKLYTSKRHHQLSSGCSVSRSKHQLKSYELGAFLLSTNYYY